jgi:hypothetical protein
LGADPILDEIKKLYVGEAVKYVLKLKSYIFVHNKKWWSISGFFCERFQGIAGVVRLVT